MGVSALGTLCGDLVLELIVVLAVMAVIKVELQMLASATDHHEELELCTGLYRQSGSQD